MSDLRIRLLGGLEVEGLAPTAIGSRHARTLLAALAVGYPEPQPPHRLVAAVWGSEPPERAEEQLGVLLSRLRAALGPERLERLPGGILVHPDWLDVAEVVALADRAGERHRAGDPLGAHLAATMALDLVGGELLPEHDGDWAAGPRAGVARLVAALEAVVAEVDPRTGDLEEAWADAEAALVEGPPAGAAELAAWVAYHRGDLDAVLVHAEEGAATTLAAERRASCLALAGRALHGQGRLDAADGRLAEAATCRAPGVAGLGRVWLAALRLDQGRAREALPLLTPEPTGAARRNHPVLEQEALAIRLDALAQMGEVATAFLVLDAWRTSLDDEDPPPEHRAAFHNASAVLLGAVGVLGDAHGHSLRALELVPAGGEPANRALLDLAAAALDAGDLDEAERWLERLVLVDEAGDPVVWHQRQRADLLKSRLAQLEGYATLALDLAERVAERARRGGAVRTALLADARAAIGAAAAGAGPADADLDRALDGLDEVAALEAWRATAEAARVTGRADLWSAASARARRLAERSGGWREMVAAFTAAELDRLR